MKDRSNKILMIRFSSFGDVVQALSVASRLAEQGEVHWAVRTDLAPLLTGHPSIKKVWILDRREGIAGLFHLIQNLRQENFTHIYDAHNNLRSNLVTFFLCPLVNPARLFNPPRLLQKSQKRWKRFLLFNFRCNLFEKPFSGQRDLLEPLAEWGLSCDLPPTPQIFPPQAPQQIVDQELQKIALNDFIALCPSAAYELKRWPLDHWKKLIELCPQEKFVLLGGLKDGFVSDLVSLGPDRVFNFAGRLSLMESAALIERAKMVITNDTGLLHVAEQLGKPTAALMGPAPFGFPSRPSTVVFERDLTCRPCSKHGQGPCRNSELHKCMVDIRPEEVAAFIKGCS